MKRITLLIVLLWQVCLAFAQWGPQSKVESHTFHSKVLGSDREYTIYFPKSYAVEQDRKYPILYLLHGMSDTDKAWFWRGHAGEVMDQLVASGEAVEMIIVSPNAGGSFDEGNWNGYFDMPGWKYETFFYTEFLPYIESTYRIIGDKAHRAVAGLSMGGGGATSYGQKHTELFSSVYAISALMTIPQRGAAQPSKPGDKLAILTQSVIDNSCVKYVRLAKACWVRNILNSPIASFLPTTSPCPLLVCWQAPWTILPVVFSMSLPNSSRNNRPPSS